MAQARDKQAAGGGAQPPPETPFLSDVATLRERARKHIDEGAVTATYGLTAETVVKVLNDALATEIVCVLRYRRHYYMAKGIHSESVKAESSSTPTTSRPTPTGWRNALCSSVASPTSRRKASRRAPTRSTSQERRCAR